jgi:[ribosomal protein S18]-alanine N-acetyltransferase
VSFSVRAMTVQDINDLVMLAARFVEAPHWSRRDYEKILLPDLPRAAPPGGLTRCAFITLCDSTLAGFAVASWLPQEAAAEVEGLVVDEKYRRQGMASALLRACMEWAANAGASNMRLEVRASNTAALALYQRHGFSALGRRYAYYSAPVEDAVLLQAPLDSAKLSEGRHPL